MLDLGINSDSINYEVALEVLGQSWQPILTEIRCEKEKQFPSDSFMNLETAVELSRFF